MEASRVSISAQTFAKLHETHNLTAKRRRELRIEGVKQYIRETPAGQGIKVEKLINAAGYRANGSYSPGYKSGHQFINKLVKKGIISRFGSHTNSPCYTVTSDVKKFNSPVLQASVQVVDKLPDQEKKEEVKYNLTREDEMPDKPYDVAHEKSDRPATSEMSSYSFELTVAKRGTHGDFGKLRMGQLEMTDVSLDTIETMIVKLLSNIS